jgi:hypothetical protein
MLDKVRNKENEKNLGSQRFKHLRERKTGLDYFAKNLKANERPEESITLRYQKTKKLRNWKKSCRSKGCG